MNSPTEPGPYWATSRITGKKLLLQVVELDGILMVLMPRDDTFDFEHVPADSLGCEWERLFTIEEANNQTK
ncbi:MAG: hypothetical protein WCL08_09845 [Verrucomicrobiota bacterium]